jgi:hypothetical protein
MDVMVCCGRKHAIESGASSTTASLFWCHSYDYRRAQNRSDETQSISTCNNTDTSSRQTDHQGKTPIAHLVLSYAATIVTRVARRLTSHADTTGDVIGNRAGHNQRQLNTSTKQPNGPQRCSWASDITNACAMSTIRT